jgi:hypothetical protein
LVFESLARNVTVIQRADFHLRFGDLLLNLATLRRSREDADAARAVLSDAVAFYAALGRSAAAAGSKGTAESVLENLSRLMARLTDSDRRMFAAPYQSLQQQLGSGASTRD